MRDKVLSHTRGQVEKPIQLVRVKNEFSDRQAKCLDKVNACEKGNAKPVRLLWATLIKYFSVVLKGK